MNPAYWWWIATAALIALELFSGTFYLLMLALGTAAGGLVQLAGGSSTLQIVAAAIVASVTTSVWHLKRYRHPRSAPYAANKDVMIDIGSPVMVDQWMPDGTAVVRYRGAQWAARWVGQGEPVAGACFIKALDGNQLQLDDAANTATQKA